MKRVAVLLVASAAGVWAQGRDANDAWRFPRGTEWIPVIVILGLIGLACRPATRTQITKALTGAHRVLVFQPVGASAPQPPAFRGRPVLRGILGQYAGAILSLEGAHSTLGRDPSAANLVFDGDATGVSKRHCSVHFDAVR